MRVCSYCHQLVADGEATCSRDGAVTRDVTFVRVPGQVHARFPAVEPFASGGTGSVYLAVQAQSGYRGLLKILSPEIANSPAERMRLKRELRKQTALTNNALARIIDGGEVGNDLWLFRDFVPGDSLAIHLRRDGALPLPDALAVVAQIASALDELHRQGLLHRDVKPGHVLLTPRVDAVPLVTLIDAGVAPKLPSQSVFEILGTADYVAPEILAGKPASFRSDLYALGCVLYEMLSGMPPFVADSVEELLTAQRELEPRELSVELPAPVRALLGSLMAKEPRKRPFSAQQVRRALDPYLPPTTPEPSSGTRTLAGTMSSPPVEPGSPASPVSPVASRPAARPAAQSSAPPVPPARVPSGPLNVPAPVLRRPPSTPQKAPRAVDATHELELVDVEEAWPEQHTEEIDVTELQSASGPSWPRADAVPAASSLVNPVASPAALSSAAPGVVSAAASVPESIPSAPRAENVPDAPTVVQSMESVAPLLTAAAQPQIMADPPPPPAPAMAALDAPVGTATGSSGEATDDPQADPRDDTHGADVPDEPTIVQPMASIKRPSAAPPASDLDESRAARGTDASLEARRASRKSVDFDVESLFHDDLESDKKPIVSAPQAQAAHVPAQLPQSTHPAPFIPAPQPVQSVPLAEAANDREPPDYEDPFTPAASAPSVAPPRYDRSPAPPSNVQSSTSALDEPPFADPEGTVVVQRRLSPAPRKPPIALIAGSATVALIAAVLMMRACSHASHEVVATPLPPIAPSVIEPPSGTSGTAPSGTAPSGTAPTPEVAAAPAAAAPAPTPSAAPTPTAEQPASANAAPSAENVPTAASPNPSAATAAPAVKGEHHAHSAAPTAYRPPPTVEPGVDYKAKGRELYQAGKFREAAEMYEKATQQTPSDAGAFAGLGASQLAANQPARAILAYQRAVQLKPTISGFQAALGRAYLQKGDRGRAAAAYRKAVDLDPNNTAAKAALQGL